MNISPKAIKYPPKEIFVPSGLEKRDFEYIILWMLNNNDECNWSCFLEEPLSFSLATLSKYMNQLISEGYVKKKRKGIYIITNDGQKRFTSKRLSDSYDRKIRYPPQVILNKRNYNHIILWMLFNNEICTRSDFMDKPLLINHHSVTKSLTNLIDKNLIAHENSEYKITELGIVKYNNMLQKYQLDPQTILKEEISNLKELKKRTNDLLDKFQINESEIKIRIIEWMNFFEIDECEKILPSTEDFHKILMYLSFNHPLEYPKYVSLDDFSTKYKIVSATIEYFLEKASHDTLSNSIFFRLRMNEDQEYYFRKNDTIEKSLKMIIEENISNYGYSHELQTKFTPEKNAIQSAEILDMIAIVIRNKYFPLTNKITLYQFLQSYFSHLKDQIQRTNTKDDPLENLKKNMLSNMIELNLEDVPQLEKKKYKLTSLVRDFPRYSIIDDLKRKNS